MTELLRALADVGVSPEASGRIHCLSKTPFGTPAIRLHLKRSFERALPWFWRHARVLSGGWKFAPPLALDELPPPVFEAKYDGVRAKYSPDGRSVERGTFCAVCGVLINEGWDLCSKCEEVL